MKRSDLNPHNFPTTPEIEAELDILYGRLLKVEEAYGEELEMVSGLRTEAFNATVPGSAKKSKHIKGQAGDVRDRNRKLKEWVLKNLDKLEEFELWIEDPDYTPEWIHFQTVPPKSGKRVFIP